jgi:hypothetical protein
MEWQPIETAPEGGTWILTWNEGDPRPQITYWTGNLALLMRMKKKSGKVTYTHWMPLPPPPSEG